MLSILNLFFKLEYQWPRTVN